MRSRLTHLTLTNFRSYSTAALNTGGAGAYLFGPNGAGKTNLLEAISLFSPGRGLRGAPMAELGRRMPGEAQGRPWAVSAQIDDGGAEGPIRLGVGTGAPGSSRRQVRLEGEPVVPGRMADLIRPIWLTPAQDRLFIEPAGERRRFFDRLVFAAEPLHAAHAAAYDRAMRERTRLLAEPGPDPAWLSALETRMAEAGAMLADARATTLAALQAEIDGRYDRPFPQARLTLSGTWELLAAQETPFDEIEARLAAALRDGRERDAAAGRALIGPHRGDLTVIHAGKDRPAAECSTGEQKALVLNLVLAQGARLSRAESAPNPILLLDEVAAHLDPIRRAALFDELEALGLQSFLTGTDETLFDHLKGRALGVKVEDAALSLLP